MSSKSTSSSVQRLLLAVALLLVGGALAFGIREEWRRTLSREQDKLLTQAHVIQVNIGQNLVSVNQVLDDLSKELSGHPFEPRLNQRLKTLTDAMPSMRTLLVLDAEGIVRSASRENVIDVDASRRAYFRRPQEHRNTSTLYVSPPFRTVLGTFTINVGRVITGPRGEFAGVVSAALDPAYFLPLLDSVRYAPDMWSTIAHGEGDVLMIVPEREGVAGRNLAQPNTFFSLHRASGQPTTLHAGTAYITSDERLLAWSTVAPEGVKLDHPLMVGVARDYADVFAPWHRDAAVQASLYALLVLACVVALLAYQRRQREFERRTAADAEALQESERRMHALLDASPESTLLLDPAGVVLAINRAGAMRFGKTPDDMKGDNLFDYLPPELAQTRHAALAEVAATAAPLQTSDHRGAIDFENTLLPVVAGNGKVESIAVYARDVTEQLRTQRVDAMFHRLDLLLLKWRMDLTTIAQVFCEEVRPMFDFVAVRIGRSEPDGKVTFIAGSEDVDGEMSAQVAKANGEHKPPALCGNCVDEVLRGDRMRRIVIEESDCPSCRDAALAAGIDAALVVPLTLRGKTWGVLAFCARDRSFFERPEIPPRLTTIASRLCVSLESSLHQEWLALLDTALSTAGNAVFITDAEGRILWTNPAFTQLSGFTAEEIVGKTPSVFSSGAHDASFYRSFWQTITVGDTWHGEVVNARRDGSRYTVNQTVTPLRDASDRIGHYVSILEDISERKADEERIRHMANFDALTDLPNRTTFFDRLGQALALARRERHSLALLFLDLDRFKQVNDDFGHDAGDLLLQAVAARLRKLVRETDTVARLAGDEFTLILPRVANADDAMLVAEKAIAALSSPFDLDGQKAHIGVSIGIALFPQHADNVEHLVSAADEAMYVAKHEGRNAARIYHRGDGAHPQAAVAHAFRGAPATPRR